MEEGELYLRPEEYGDYDEMEEGQITAYPDELDNEQQLRAISKNLFKNNCQEVTLQNIIGSDKYILYLDSDEFIIELLGSIYTNSTIEKLSKIYPEYNFATIHITVLDGIVVNRTNEPRYIRMIRKTNSQYMFIDVTIKFKFTDEDRKPHYHANSVFVDKINLTAEYFEPQHDSETDLQIQLQVSRILRKFIHENIRMTITSQSCPNLGPQSVTEDEFCQTWSAMFLYYKINYPEITIQEIYTYFSKMSKDLLKLHIDKFIRCFVWVITDRVELFITAIIIIIGYVNDTIIYIQKNINFPEKFEGININMYIITAGIILRKGSELDYVVSNTVDTPDNKLYKYTEAKAIYDMLLTVSDDFNQLRYHDMMDKRTELDILIEQAQKDMDNTE